VNGSMVIIISAGLPVTTAPRCARASITAPPRAAGTKTRRTAVHFLPVFWVISRTTSFRESLKASEPSAMSGPSTVAFRLSASTLTRTFVLRRFKPRRRH